jgi:hypothetical protein
MPHGRWPALLWVLALWGCAAAPPPVTLQPGSGGLTVGVCRSLYASADRFAACCGVRDGGASPVAGYPYLRSDRFLASFRDEIDSAAKWDLWLGRMEALDRQARGLEQANRPLDGAPPGWLQTCGPLLRAAELPVIENLPALRDAVAVPDEYRPLRRVLGLYPLIRPFVVRGVAQWREEARASSAPPLLPEGQAIVHAPADAPPAGGSRPREILRGTPPDPLGIPLFTPEDLNDLFQAYAPLWVLEGDAPWDRIGAPRWESDGRVGFDAADHRVYTRLSFTRFGGEVLTQLNYSVWFAERPKSHPLDLYGGLLDGVTYRLTLDREGSPLLQETVHNCGCFHRAFPSERLAPKEAGEDPEPPLILPAAVFDPAAARPAVFIAAGSHQVRALQALPHGPYPAQRSYALADYDALRSLPTPAGGRRSLFGVQGIVPGTERLERWLLWPSGVPSPGAMRQAGRQAVTLLGERHFDDPFYMERFFAPLPAGEPAAETPIAPPVAQAKRAFKDLR